MKELTINEVKEVSGAACSDWGATKATIGEFAAGFVGGGLATLASGPFALGTAIGAGGLTTASTYYATCWMD